MGCLIAACLITLELVAGGEHDAFARRVRFLAAPASVAAPVRDVFSPESIRAAVGTSPSVAARARRAGGLHPAGLGALIGAGGGLLIGAFAIQPPEGGYLLYGRAGTVLLTTGVGAGVGAAVGALIAWLK